MTTRESLSQLQAACRALLAAVDCVMKSLPAAPCSPRAEIIIARVADEYGYSFAMMQSRERTQRVAEARHVGIYLASENTGAIQRELGEILKRDTASIAYALATVRDRHETDPLFAARVDRIRSKLVEQKEAA
jgi:chromosomal replication initiation ATPase DnaA